MILKRVSQPGTFERIRTWILESRPPGSRVVLDGRYYALVVEGTQVGAVGVKRLSWFATEIKHFVVAPEFRRRGHGRTILRLAMEKVRTPLVLSTVRADNEWWLSVNSQEGFSSVNRMETTRGAIVLLYANAPHPHVAAGPLTPASSSENE